MPYGCHTTRHTGNCLFGNRIATVGTEHVCRWGYLRRLSKRGRRGGIEFQAGDLSRKSFVSSVRFQRCIRGDDSTFCQCLESLGSKRTASDALCISEKKVCHWKFLEKMVCQERQQEYDTLKTGAARLTKNGGNPTDESGASLVYFGRNADCVRRLIRAPPLRRQRNSISHW